jgi:hypothetical protein
MVDRDIAFGNKHELDGERLHLSSAYYDGALYEGSVAGRYRIGNVPIITIVGILATIYVSALVYFWLSVSSLGVNSPGQLSLWGGSMLVAALIYPIIYLVRRRQGINLGLVFRAVPPE